MGDRKPSSLLSPATSIKGSNRGDLLRSSLPTSTLPAPEPFSGTIEPTPKRKSFVPANLFRRRNTNRTLSQPGTQASFNGDAQAPSSPKYGDVLQLDGLGGDVEMTDGHKVTLRELVDISVDGIVLFMYPKPSASEGANQARLFRDSYQALRVMGYSVYGLSSDPPKANYKRKLKHNLPFGFLCDKDKKLTEALGFKCPRKGSTRGIIAINKDGRVMVTMSGSADGIIQAACSRLSLCP